MKQIANNALILVMKRINDCIAFQKASPDFESQFYWQEQMNKALHLKKRIEKRFNVTYNVLVVDFISKRRVA